MVVISSWELPICQMSGRDLHQTNHERCFLHFVQSSLKSSNTIKLSGGAFCSNSVAQRLDFVGQILCPSEHKKKSKLWQEPFNDQSMLL